MRVLLRPEEDDGSDFIERFLGQLLLVGGRHDSI
jgi:hypothetical protein